MSAYVEVKKNDNVVVCFIHCTDANSKIDGNIYNGLFEGSAATKIKILSCGSEIKNMNSMFCNCSSLKKLDLSNFNTKNVTDMSYMFYNCSSLTSIKFPDNVNSSNVTDMSCMFYDCSNLKELDLSNFNTDKVINMLGMFYNCFKEEQPSTLICTASTIRKITDNGNDSCLTITNENEKNNKINDILNKDNKWKVYTCTVERVGNEDNPQIIEVEEYQLQQ